MGHEHAGNYRGKHPQQTQPGSDLLKAIEDMSIDNKISCYSAHAVAAQHNSTPGEVGRAIDYLEMKICQCQLGLFGYTPEKKIARANDSLSPELTDAVLSKSREKKLGCAAAWAIAQEIGCTKIDVGDACETLAIKITVCQIGAF